MEQIPVTKFKATCLAVLAKVEKTKKPVVVTRHGKPIAEINPPSPAPRAPSWLGAMKGSVKFNGDIVSPVCDEDDWEVLR